MACDKPTGDCTNVSPCGSGCGCSGSDTPAPVLPKCQDVSLTAGTFTNATITVNSQGCITAIANGEPEQYTPDECCGSGSGGGGGTGPRGPKGDPGAAATISVNQVIGTGTSWSVENTGTSSAAVFKFTAPAPSSGGSGTTSGFTGTVNGVEVDKGLVKDMPLTLVTNVVGATAGTRAALITFGSVPDLAGKHTVTLNLDAFYTNLDDKFQDLHDDQATTITNLTASVADLLNTVTSMQDTLATQQNTIAELTNELGDLRTEFNAYVAANP